MADATHGLGVGAEGVADDGVLDQELLHSDDGDAVAVAAVDEDAAQSDAPRGVDVDTVAARLPAQHHLAGQWQRPFESQESESATSAAEVLTQW